MDGGLGDKVKGRGEEAAGKAQEEWGEATDNPEQEAKGARKQQEGTYDKTKGKLKDLGGDVKTPCLDRSSKRSTADVLPATVDHQVTQGRGLGRPQAGPMAAWLSKTVPAPACSSTHCSIPPVRTPRRGRPMSAALTS